MPAQRQQKSLKEPVAKAEVPIGTALTAHAERAANCELDLIRLFLAQQKHEIAQRRLRQLRDDFPETTAATEAQRLLKALSG
jgi:hypothetical protein